jgi:Rieske Fe-S protein
MAPSRRNFLRRVTLGLGGLVTAAILVPVARYLAFPVGRRTVRGGTEPIDVMAAEGLVRGAAPVKVELTASGVRDGWNVAEEARLGAVWLRRGEDGRVLALSSACPHLGCAIAYDRDRKVYACPCHRSAFALDGERQTGPAKRGLDPLPVTEQGGRIYVRYLRYRPDVAGREPV